LAGIETRDGPNRDQYVIPTIGDRDGKQADATVLVGGDENRFEPVLRAAKWGGEAWLSLRAPRVVTSERPLWDANAGRVHLDLGNERHRWYETALGQLEYDLVLGSAPASNVFVFAIDFPRGLDFRFQPALSQVEIDRGNIRPPNVVGSYAVYWNRRDRQYKTGKVAHIYRPIATDRAGGATFCNLSIDPAAKTLTITIPAAWLAAAAYPVVLDPTIGLSTDGGSTDGTHNYIVYQSFVASADGTTDDGTAHAWGFADSGTEVAIMGIYAGGAGSPNGRALLSNASGQITLTTSNGDRSAAQTGMPALVNGTAYGIVINNAGVGNTRYDAGGAGTIYYAARTHANDLPGTFPNNEGSFAGDLSIYIEYTEAGGGGSAPKSLMLLGVG